jgi:hypothetical protein
MRETSLGFAMCLGALLVASSARAEQKQVARKAGETLPQAVRRFHWMEPEGRTTVVPFRVPREKQMLWFWIPIDKPRLALHGVLTERFVYRHGSGHSQGAAQIQTATWRLPGGGFVGISERTVKGHPESEYNVPFVIRPGSRVAERIGIGQFYDLRATARGRAR